MSTQGHAVYIRAPGGVETLELDTYSCPNPGPNEVLVEVAAAGLNRADILQRKGTYPAPPGYPHDIPGLEYAGHVRATGDSVSTWRIGDRVMGITGGGAMATHVIVHEREILTVPQSVDVIRAAAIPEVFLTVFDALLLQAGLQPGEVVLIHAAPSGIGTAAHQVASAIGARPVGTSRSSEKLRRTPFTDSIVVENGMFATRLLELTSGRAADVILDTVGGSYVQENLKALAPKGRMILLGLLGGRRADVPLDQLLTKRITWIGTVLRGRPLEEKAILAQQFSHSLLPLFENGTLSPTIDTVLPVSQVREAHARMERGDHVGKIVLSWEGFSP